MNDHDPHLWPRAETVRHRTGDLDRPLRPTTKDVARCVLTTVASGTDRGRQH